MASKQQIVWATAAACTLTPRHADPQAGLAAASVSCRWAVC